jgi:dihydrofolate synthase/folylpolyglutamate synthase
MAFACRPSGHLISDFGFPHSGFCAVSPCLLRLRLAPRVATVIGLETHRTRNAVPLTSTVLAPGEWAALHRADDGEQQPIGPVEREFGLEVQTRRHGLELMRPLVAALGNPQLAYPTVHVTGSKGKGSTVVLLASMLRAAGYRVGTYTSPSLTQFGERITVNGVPISDSECERSLKPLRVAIDRVAAGTPRFFEVATALAFLHFAEQAVDVAVIEVGIGGQRDATNVVYPLVSLITSVELEHTQILGDTVKAIAHEKAGIIKPGRPVVTAVDEAESLAVIRQTSEGHGSDLFCLGTDFGVSQVRPGMTRQLFNCWLGGRLGPAEYADLELGLPGAAQFHNAALAVTAARLMRHALPRISEQAVRAGLSQAVWPGRLELRRPDCWVLLDVAHTPASARQLREYVGRWFPGQPRTLVIGVLREKRVHELAGEMAGAFDRVFACPVKWFRTMEPEQVEAAFGATGAATQMFGSICEAVHAAMASTPCDGLVVIAGSVFAVGEAKRRFGWLDATG